MSHTKCPTFRCNFVWITILPNCTSSVCTPVLLCGQAPPDCNLFTEKKSFSMPGVKRAKLPDDVEHAQNLSTVRLMVCLCAVIFTFSSRKVMVRVELTSRRPGRSRMSSRCLRTLLEETFALSYVAKTLSKHAHTVFPHIDGHAQTKPKRPYVQTDKAGVT